MHEFLVILGTLFGCIISYFTINKFVFYTKSEVNELFAKLKEESDKKDTDLLEKVSGSYNVLKEELIKTKDEIFKNILEVERNSTKINQEIYDRLSKNKQVFDDYNRNMIEVVAQIKQEDKQLATDFTKLLSQVKDELKSDYINRYNDLLKLINNKVSSSDFDRLENKFDKVTETITELKTIVQLRMEEHE